MSSNRNDSDRIPLSRPYISENDIAAVNGVLRSGQLSRGPELDLFETAMSKYVEVKEGVGVSSGTAGLHLGIKALGFEPGDEIITTPFSFIASANVLLYEDLKPVFVDIDPNSLNIDPDRIEAAITSRTKAILIVHIFGNSADMWKIGRIASAHDLKVIEDSCEALGSRFREKKLGSFGDFSVFGFYANKQITTGEGGMWLSNESRLAEKVRILRNQGRDPKLDWLDQTQLGYNYRLSDIHAALGRSQLVRIENTINRRRLLAEMYDEQLADCEHFVTPPRPDNPLEMSWFVYVIRLSTKFGRTERDKVVERLDGLGIQCGRYFAPIHLMPYYRENLGYSKGDYPIAEQVADRSLALPFFTGLTGDEVRRVCDHLKKSVKAITDRLN